MITSNSAYKTILKPDKLKYEIKNDSSIILDIFILLASLKPL